MRGGVGLSVTRSEQSRPIIWFWPSPDCLEGMKKTKTDLNPDTDSNLALPECKYRSARGIPVEKIVRIFHSMFCFYLITPVIYLTTL
jgi:hypothetical protein